MSVSPDPSRFHLGGKHQKTTTRACYQAPLATQLTTNWKYGSAKPWPILGDPFLALRFVHRPSSSPAGLSLPLHPGQGKEGLHLCAPLGACKRCEAGAGENKSQGFKPKSKPPTQTTNQGLLSLKKKKKRKTVDGHARKLVAKSGTYERMGTALSAGAWLSFGFTDSDT